MYTDCDLDCAARSRFYMDFWIFKDVQLLWSGTWGGPWAISRPHSPLVSNTPIRCILTPPGSEVQSFSLCKKCWTYQCPCLLLSFAWVIRQSVRISACLQSTKEELIQSLICPAPPLRSAFVRGNNLLSATSWSGRYPSQDYHSTYLLPPFQFQLICTKDCFSPLRFRFPVAMSTCTSASQWPWAPVLAPRTKTVRKSARLAVLSVLPYKPISETGILNISPFRRFKSIQTWFRVLLWACRLFVSFSKSYWSIKACFSAICDLLWLSFS